MSYGIVICSKCHREVHQDGPEHSWRHCEDKTPRCNDADSIYPDSSTNIVGKFCARDGF